MEVLKVALSCMHASCIRDIAKNIAKVHNLVPILHQGLDMLVEVCFANLTT